MARAAFRTPDREVRRLSAEPSRPKIADSAAGLLGDAFARKEVEAALRATFELAAVGMALVDVGGRWLRVNARLCHILGYTREELERLTFRDITHPDDLADNLVLVRRLLAGEIDTYDIEKRYLRKDGAPIWAHVAVSLVRDEDGEPHCLVCVVEDITERKRAQEALRDSEQRLSVALKAGQLGSWQLDLATNELTASDTYKEIFGLPPDAAFTYEMLLSLVHPEDRERRRAAVAQAIATGVDYDIEYRSLWPDGSVHWVMARGRVINDRDGKPLRLVGVALDTTERHRSEDELRRLNDTLEQRVRQRTRQLESEIERRARAREALRASEARYAAVFEHTSAGIILLSVMPDGRFVYDAVNPTHERFTGMTAAEFAGVTSHDLFPRELADRLVERYRRCVETEAPLSYEDTFPYRAGTRVLQATVVPIRDGAGKISTLLISTHDVTQRKQAEEALRQGQKMEAVGQLTGGVAHDFNNLLTAVLGNLELLGHRVDDPGSRKLVEGAMRAAERGAKLTQQLLAFARKQRLEPKPADLNRLIAGMVDMLLSTIGATVRIETVLGEGLWPAMLDANQIELVLLNLAINARDAMPKGGVLTITAENLRVGARQRPADLLPGDYVVLSVADTGTGMSEEVKARAFEPFFTTKAVGKGSGLGLSQVYGIARQLGGGVDIESRPGAGSTVRVYLPRARQAAPEPGAEPAANLVAAQPAARILVVDDDSYVRDFVASCLDSFGYDVVAAPDALAALDVIASGAPVDLLLVDFAMPEINGIELVRRAKQQRPWLNVLFMTGYAHTAALDQEMAGIAVMRKPFKLNELAAAVRAALRHPAQGQAKILPLRRAMRD
jgi:PAS domain S-box-containing protein